MVNCLHSHIWDAISPPCFGFLFCIAMRTSDTCTPFGFENSWAKLSLSSPRLYLVLTEGAEWQSSCFPEIWFSPNSLTRNLRIYNEKTAPSALILSHLGFAGLPEEGHLSVVVGFLYLSAFHLPATNILVPLSFLLWPFIHGRLKIRFQLLSASPFHSQYWKRTSTN